MLHHHHRSSPAQATTILKFFLAVEVLHPVLSTLAYLAEEAGFVKISYLQHQFKYGPSNVSDKYQGNYNDDAPEDNND